MTSLVRGNFFARHSRALARLVGLICLAIVACSAYVSQHWWREGGLRALEARNEPRAELVASALRSEINRQDHLPIVLSLDAEVREVLQTPGDQARIGALNSKLHRIREEADAGALYVVSRDGTIVAADQPESEAQPALGRSLAASSYFMKAIESGRSSYLGVNPSSGQVRYILAEAINAPAPIGVAIVSIDFSALETTWAQALENVLVTDADGVVFLASDPSYKYRRINSAQSAHVATEAAPAAYPKHADKPLDLTTLEHRGSNAVVNLGTREHQESFFYIALPLPEYGWTIHRLTDLSVVNADQRDGGIIGAAASSVVILLLLYIVQRHRALQGARQARALLQSEVAERTQELSDANTALREEVAERSRTEARLRNTQNELVQAGKLAALGQMSAAIAHEVNQPLGAIRTFLASTKVYLQRSDLKSVTKNLDLIDGLAERMAAITQHLKSFARKSDTRHPEPVDVAKAIDGALFLLESEIKSARVAIVREVDSALLVSGHSVQLEQVLLNLIQNAVDAVSGVKLPKVEISARGGDGAVRIVVADNGPGIDADVIERVFDPFVTTKPLGKGLGLGLSIAYGIVQDFRGHMRASNRPQGGAEFVLELPLWTAEVRALEGATNA
jgi:two-component system C4-dicarboxylate transport sensor histidine kinase DctB